MENEPRRPKLAERGRGRPGKDWAAQAAAKGAASSEPASSPDLDAYEAGLSKTDVCNCAWDTVDAELLLQYVSFTSISLIRSNGPDHHLVKFWSHNLPQIGPSHYFVMHLIMAIAGHHLMYLRADASRTQYYTRLARRHPSASIARFNAALATLVASNAGALFVRSPRATPRQGSTPTFLREGLPRVDWDATVRRLRDPVAGSPASGAECCLAALRELDVIYEATYGNSSGAYNGPLESSQVFGWLHRVMTGFMACLQQREPLVLLVLAYYTVLFRAMGECWLMDGWMEYLVYKINGLLGDNFAVWMQWPII
ncbi:hypothetical protein DL768_010306 [Monosporascus sp. mg162]|nr:hypothetical protein DL768_010306 [Monosporascus sp. mg162]